MNTLSVEFDYDISEADAAYLATQPLRPVRCIWCFRIIGTGHTEACQEMHDGWAMKMPFGKHRGAPVAKVPRSYLQWAVRNCDAMGSELKAEVERVLETAREKLG